MRHETAQLYLRPDACPDALQEELQRSMHKLPGLAHCSLGRNLDGSWGAGDFTLDVLASAARPASDIVTLLQEHGIARVDRATYRRIDGGQRAVGLHKGIWRTLMIRVRPGSPAARVQALEQDLLRMPCYIASIGNWQLGRVSSDSTWTHIWQQEFASIDGLLGEYLSHPFHWGWVDRWFDPEFPEHCVEAIAHAFCPQATSLLTHPANSHAPAMASPERR